MDQWTVCSENSLVDSVTAQAGAGFGEDKLNLKDHRYQQSQTLSQGEF